jgi:hypothetical protein
MAKMRITAVAVDLGAGHEKRTVLLFAHHLAARAIDGLIERRPAGAAFELMGLIKERRAAACAAEGAGGLGEVVVGPCALGSVFAGHAVGFGRTAGCAILRRTLITLSIWAPECVS